MSTTPLPPLALLNLRVSPQPQLTLSSKFDSWVKESPDPPRKPCPARTGTSWATRAQDGVSSRTHEWFLPFCFFAQVGVSPGSELSSEPFLLCLFYALKAHQLPIQFPLLPFSLAKQDLQALLCLSEESLLFKIPAAGIKEIMPEEALCKL